MRADERRSTRTLAAPQRKALWSPLPGWLSPSASKAVVRTAADAEPEYMEVGPAAVVTVTAVEKEELEKVGVARVVRAAAAAVAREREACAHEACADDEYAVCARVAREYEDSPPDCHMGSHTGDASCTETVQMPACLVRRARKNKWVPADGKQACALLWCSIHVGILLYFCKFFQESH